MYSSGLKSPDSASMKDWAIVTSASETDTVSGGAANSPERSSSGQSIVCMTRSPSRGRTSASASRERSATFTSAHCPVLTSASRSSTYGLVPGPSACMK